MKSRGALNAALVALIVVVTASSVACVATARDDQVLEASEVGGALAASAAQLRVDEQTPASTESTKTREEQGEALYARARRLLSHVETHSAFTPAPARLHPRSSIFALSSYKPVLEVWAASDRKPAAFLSRLLSARTTTTPSKDSKASLLRWQRRIAANLVRTLVRVFFPRPSSPSKTLGHKEAEEATRRAAELLEKAAYEHGSPAAALALGDLWLWGGSVPGLLPRNTTRAMDAFQWVADLTGNATAQAALGFLYATGYDGILGDDLTNVGDQATALLYHTFAGLGGDFGAKQAAGYRHWAGIGTKQSCAEALPFYKSAADKAMQMFNEGPPGGLHLPPTKLRLSDRDGGVYGPGASVVSAGQLKVHQGHHHPASLQEWEDVLEFYQFHADRGDAAFMFRLGRIYYQGFGSAGDGIQDFGTTGGRDFSKALKWFFRIARAVWPRDPEAATGSSAQAVQGQRHGTVNSVYDATKDVKIKGDGDLYAAAGLAAGFIGKMYLRGEGVPRNYPKAFLWLSRGASQGDRESHNTLGVMFRDGLGMPVELSKAVTYFTAAAQHDHAEAAVNMGKFYLGINDFANAGQHFESSIKNGDAFQAYYYLAELNAMQPNRPDLCHIAVAFYKRVSERGDWHNEVFWRAEKAWADGDEATALLGYWMMAERGYEVAQNNVAYILDRDKRRLQLPTEISASKAYDRLALTHWTRSAAQDNIDALVKMGDYYLSGTGSLSGERQPEKAAACYQTASNMHVSAMAMWNLGWMHENGIGVARDFHLAKRYYDLALETNTEASLPVSVSLLKLYARSLWDAIVHGDTKSLSIFTSPADDFADASWWTLRKVREEFARRWLGVNRPPLGDAPAAPQPAAEPKAPAAQPPQRASEPDPAGNDQEAAQRALQQDEDPVEWARNARQRERLTGEGEDDDDIYFNPDGGEDVMETVGILLLCLGAGVFVLVRQQREQANARAEAARRAGVQPGAQAGAAPPAQPPRANPAPAIPEEPVARRRSPHEASSDADDASP